MTPFSPDVREQILLRDKYICQDCGKSTFDAEKWLIEASHESHERGEQYDKRESGKARDRICHLLHDLDMGDIVAVNLTANRIWNTGLRHYSYYERNPHMFREDRIQFAELLSALQLQGKVHITEVVSNVSQLKPYVIQQMAQYRGRNGK